MLKTFARAQGVTGQRVCVCVLDWAATPSDTHTRKRVVVPHTPKGVAAE
jgi:hypothetical protein